MVQRQRVLYLDVLRVLAMIAVVTIHITAADFYSINISSSAWIIRTVYNSLARWAVPIFIMVSGVVFLNPEKTLLTRNIFTKYIPRLAVSFIFWSAVYLLLKIVLFKQEMSTGNIIKAFITGHYHLWYLPMSMGLYLVTPVLRRLITDKKTTMYFLCLSFVITFIIPSILEIARLIDGRLFDVGNLFVKQFNLYLPLGYTAYFMLGEFIDKTSISKRIEHIVYILGGVGGIYTTLMTIIASLKNNSAYTGFLGYCSINVLFESLAIFIFAKTHLNRFKHNSIKEGFLWFAMRSFGVYLTHAIFVDLMHSFFPNSIHYYPIVSIPISICAVVLISTGCSTVLNQIPYVNTIV